MRSGRGPTLFHISRRATGTIIEKAGRGGETVRALRFTAYGKRRYLTLGSVTAAEAERELQRILADIEHGAWRAPRRGELPRQIVRVPGFRAFAEEWWLCTESLLARATQRGYRWRLDRHLLPYFAELRLDQITQDVVDRYIVAKLSEEEPLSATSISMTITLLGAILESAVERGLMAHNPARGRRVRVRERPSQRNHLERAAQIEVLLEAASELDHAPSPGAHHVERRAMLATLIFAGLRIGELCALRWCDIDLASGWMTILDTKTDAGRRRVNVRGALGDELRAVRARSSRAAPDAFVFLTRRGRRQDAHNFRARVLLPVIARANANLAERGLPPLPEWITLHSLRRTFVSMLCVLGEDPVVAMDEIGHTDPGPTLAVYRRATQLPAGEKTRLRALVERSKSQWCRGGAAGPVNVVETQQAALPGSAS